LTINGEVREYLKSRASDGEIKFMVYDGRFWDYYNRLSANKQKLFILWIVASFLFIIQCSYVKGIFAADSSLATPVAA